MSPGVAPAEVLVPLLWAVHRLSLPGSGGIEAVATAGMWWLQGKAVRHLLGTEARAARVAATAHAGTILAMVAVERVLGGPVDVALAHQVVQVSGLAILATSAALVAFLGIAVARRRATALLAWLALVGLAPSHLLDPAGCLARALAGSLVPTFRSGRGVPRERIRLSLRPGADEVRPDLFLVVWESIHGGYLGARTADGRAVLPFVESLASRGLLLTRFYAVSVHSSRTLAPLLAGRFPVAQTSALDLPEPLPPALPQWLADLGYESRYFSACSDLGFEGYDGYLPRLGFREVVSVQPSDLPLGERSAFWGWGLQDDRFFRWVLDRLEREDRADPGRGPRLTVLTTSSNHLPFRLPKGTSPLLVDPPRSEQDHHRNSAHLADAWLAGFVTELERRAARPWVMVISGDHGSDPGFPPGWFGSHQESTFLTVGAVLGPGLEGRGLAPGAVREPTSQLDLVPTLLDLAGAEVPPGFEGRSLLGSEARAPDRTMVMFHPFLGGRRIAVRDRWKLVERLGPGTPREVYDLVADPAEAAPLPVELLPAAVKVELEAALTRWERAIR